MNRLGDICWCMRMLSNPYTYTRRGADGKLYCEMCGGAVKQESK